jgi:hypothetical protein
VTSSFVLKTKNFIERAEIDDEGSIKEKQLKALAETIPREPFYCGKNKGCGHV